MNRRRVAKVFASLMLLSVPLFGQTANFNFVSIDIAGAAETQVRGSGRRLPGR
jgi:hypothetical protein